MHRAWCALSAVVAVLVSLTAFTAAAPARAVDSLQPEHLSGIVDPVEGGGAGDEGSTAGGGGAATPVDLEVLYMAAWLGVGSPVTVIAVVRNSGSAPSTGHSLDFFPEVGSDRTVTAPNQCVQRDLGFRCAGAALQPGETRSYSFRFSVPASETEAWPPFWVSAVTGDEPDPVAENNRAVFELPDAVHVQVESDIKTRVEDENGDGRANVGEKMEIYAYFVNDSEYELQDVQVEISGTAWDHRLLPQTIAPGAETTVRFDATVPDLGPTAVSGVQARVTARAVGGSVSVWSGVLMLLGEGAVPNPEGLSGPQPEPTRDDPQGVAFVDPQEILAREALAAGSGQSVDESVRRDPAHTDPVPGLVASSQPTEPVQEAETVQARAVAQRPAASASSSAHPQGNPLAVSGVEAQWGALLAAHALIGAGVILAQIGLGQQLSRRRRHSYGMAEPLS